MKFKTASGTRFTDGITAEQASAQRAEGNFVSEENPSERFARASDRRHGLDNGRPSADQMAAMSPAERFKAVSDARNRLNPRYAEEARRRRRD